MRINTYPQGFSRTSAGFSNWHIGNYLGDRKIQEYARKGFYGQALQDIILTKDKKRKEVAKKKLLTEKNRKEILKYLLS